MSRVFQRPGRGGYYLAIAVPRELRKKLRKSHFKTIIVEKKKKYKLWTVDSERDFFLRLLVNYQKQLDNLFSDGYS